MVLFKIQQNQIRKEIKKQIKENLDSQELSMIRVTSENQNQLHWEHNKEFRYRGIMYDVVKKEVIDNVTTIYYCITDTQETTLFACLDSLINKSMETKCNGIHPLKNLLKFLSNLYFLVPYIGSDFSFKKVLFYAYNGNYHQPWFEIDSPPPKFI